MEVFRDVVKDTLEKIDNTVPAKDNNTSRPGSKLFPCNQADVDQHSGLRIRLEYFVTVFAMWSMFSVMPIDYVNSPHGFLCNKKLPAHLLMSTGKNCL